MRQIQTRKDWKIERWVSTADSAAIIQTNKTTNAKLNKLKYEWNYKYKYKYKYKYNEWNVEQRVSSD